MSLGISQRNEQLTTPLRVDIRDQYNEQIHVCRSVGFITPPPDDGKDYIYKRRKETSRREETRLNVANDRRCISECCVHQLSPIDTITAFSEPVHSSNSNENKLNANHLRRYPLIEKIEKENG